MGKRKVDLDAPYQGLRVASLITGQAVSWLRDGCKNGTIPHIRVGQEYRINVPRLLEQLEAESMSSVKAGGQTA